MITATWTVWTALRSEGPRPEAGPRATLGQLAQAPRIPPQGRRHSPFRESEWPKQRGNTAPDRRLAKPAILMTMTLDRPVTLDGGTGRVSRTFGIRPEQSASRCHDQTQASLQVSDPFPIRRWRCRGGLLHNAKKLLMHGFTTKITRVRRELRVPVQPSSTDLSSRPGGFGEPCERRRCAGPDAVPVPMLVQPSRRAFGWADSARSKTRDTAPIAATFSPSLVEATAVACVARTNGDLATIGSMVARRRSPSTCQVGHRAAGTRFRTGPEPRRVLPDAVVGVRRLGARALLRQ